MIISCCCAPRPTRGRRESNHAYKRVVTTLREWGIEVDEVFFLGGIEKRLSRLLGSVRFLFAVARASWTEATVPLPTMLSGQCVT